MNWYVVVTNPKCEHRAEDGLRAKGFVTYLPTFQEDRKQTARAKRKKLPPIVTRLMFPRYLFVTFTRGTSWFDLRRTDGVEGVLSMGFDLDRRPVSVPGEVIEDLRVAQDMGLFDKVRGAGPVFDPGTHVRIKTGPFLGFEAVVERALPGKSAEVVMNLFGRETRSLISLEDIAKLPEAA